MTNLPLARHQNIVVQELDKEILVYDLLTHKTYNLNETSAIVYQACGDGTTFSELKRKHKFTDEIIFLALDELKKENLLEANGSYASPFSGMTRREVIKKVGLASMIALPVISSLVAPTAAMAQSGGPAVTCSDFGTPNARGNCPLSSQRCVSGFCEPCLPVGTPVPGGCSGINGIICCSGGCNLANQCI